MIDSFYYILSHLTSNFFSLIYLFGFVCFALCIIHLICIFFLGFNLLDPLTVALSPFLLTSEKFAHIVDIIYFTIVAAAVIFVLITFYSHPLTGNQDKILHTEIKTNVQTNNSTLNTKEIQEPPHYINQSNKQYNTEPINTESENNLNTKKEIKSENLQKNEFIDNKSIQTNNNINSTKNNAKNINSANKEPSDIENKNKAINQAISIFK